MRGFLSSKLSRAVLLLLVLTLAACGSEPSFPLGHQKAEGIISRVPLSLTRRGTHILRNATTGEDIVYLESTLVNLGRLEGKNVQIDGIVEPNTERRELPVLVVAEVLRGGDDALKAWSISSLKLTIQLPDTWQGTIKNEEAAALFSFSGAVRPILEIRSLKTDTLPFTFRTLSAASGSALKITPLIVGLQKAAGVLDETNHTWTAYISSPSVTDGSEVLTLAFALSEEDPIPQQVERIQRFMRTLKFTEVARSSAAAMTGTGSALGQPCGGVAGILCPTGFYCSVEDKVSNTGHCKQI